MIQTLPKFEFVKIHFCHGNSSLKKAGKDTLYIFGNYRPKPTVQILPLTSACTNTVAYSEFPLGMFNISKYVWCKFLGKTARHISTAVRF